MARAGDWDDPDELRHDELHDSHDAELGEHDRRLSRLGGRISRLAGRQEVTDARVDDHEDRIVGLEAGQGAVIDELARLQRERDHAVRYAEKVSAGEAAGRGPYRCSGCGDIGHNAARHR